MLELREFSKVCRRTALLLELRERGKWQVLFSGGKLNWFQFFQSWQLPKSGIDCRSFREFVLLFLSAKILVIQG